MDRLLKAISFSKYKCFDAKTSIFNIDLNSNISLIIGRNNSGKSSVIDVIEKAVNSKSSYNVTPISNMMKIGFLTRVATLRMIEQKN
jgi:predicted ATP-dependent endonuclease of OLD family